MHFLKTIMEEDIHVFLARQILLYLPLADLLECKLVSSAWKTHIQSLFGNEWTRWANVQLTQKMSAAMNSVVGGCVVQNIHLNERYIELKEQNYKLDRCDLFNGFILLKFRKTEPTPLLKKHWFCVIAQDNISNVLYDFKYTATNGNYYRLSGSVMNWWYVLEGQHHIKLSFKVIDMSASFCEKSYETTLPLSDFASPLVVYHELISGDSSLRTAIKKQFPELNFHAYYHEPTTAIGAAVKCYDHEIFYYKRPSQETAEVWVLDTRTMKVEFKRATRKSDWVCGKNDLPLVWLIWYRHPLAIFHIKPDNAFAIWDLSQPGHPRHVGFDIQLPMEPWNRVNSHMNRSTWIIAISHADETNFIYINLPSTTSLKNSSVSCECSTHQKECALEVEKLNLKVSQSSHTPKIYEYFVGERIIIQGYLLSPEVYVRDCWK